MSADETDWDKLENELRNRHPDQFAELIDVEIPLGWFPLFGELCDRLHISLEPEQRSCFRWLQVKEKFGELRAYYAYSLDELPVAVSRLIDEYERRSVVTCIACGKLGARVSLDGWTYVMCKQHYDEAEAT